MKRETFANEWQPRILSVLRFVTALLLLQHPLVKLFSFPVPFPYPMTPLLNVAGGLELVGGVLLLLGLFTRPVAFVLSGEMAIAYFIGHATHGFYPIANMGNVAILYCFIFLYLAVAGGGEWSVDALRNRRPIKTISGR